MTITPEHSSIPRFTMGDRLRKARETTRLNQAEFAERLGISRNTVRSYETDSVRQRKVVLKQWAMASGVPLFWLETGEAPSPGGDGASDVVRPKGFEPPTF